MVKASDLIIHITGWLIFLSLPLLFISGMAENSSILPILSSLYYWLFLSFYLFVFYTHTYWVIPRLYLKKKFLAYAGVLLVFLGAVFVLRPFDHLVGQQFHPAGQIDRPGQMDRPERMGPPPDGQFSPPGDRPPPFERDGPPRGGPRGTNRVDMVSIFLFIMILALSMAVQITHRWRVTEQRAARAEADKANAELSFLKAQINPHFLFNTLNNIYSLAITHSEHTADSVMKLSNIMRYVSDDVLQDFVPLRHEADCIRDYIDLQRLRLGSKTQVSFAVPGQLDELQIAPLLLITFVENAFKYGTSNHEKSLISIDLQTSERTIRFSCRNKVFGTRRPVERTGIGIVNTKQRLEHLYPGKYMLDITNDGEFFNVQLVLQAQ